jgi:hypothetical protein
MSNANFERITYKDETAWGDGGAGNVKEVPHGTVSLAQAASFFTSRLVRSDRQTQDVVRGGFQAGGTIDYELLYRKVSATTTNAYDDFIQYALFSGAWTTPSSDVTAVTTSSGNNLFKAAAWAGFNVGDWVRLNGTGIVNQYRVIVAKPDADNVTVSPGGLANATDVVVEDGAYVANGTTTKSIALCRDFTDLSSQRAIYVGAMFDTWSLNVGLSGPVSGSFGFLAKSEDVTTASFGNPTAGFAASTNRVFDSVGHVKAFYEGSPLASFTATELGIELRNNLEGRQVIGQAGLESVKVGSCSVSGRYTRYFSDNAQLSAFLNNTETSIAVALHDVLGNAYVLWVPSAIVRAANRNGGGKDSDIRVSVEWEAKVYGGSSYAAETFRVTRFDA